MPEPRIAAIAILALTTVTAGGLAWHNYQRAEELAAAIAAARHAAERAPATIPAPRFSSAKPMEADDANDDFNPEELTKPAEDGAPGEEPRRQRFDRRNGMARMEELMQNPEFAAAYTLQSKARLDGRYADLFRQLGLPPESLDRFKTLLAERQNAWRDVMTAARSEGIGGRENRDELRELVQITQDEITRDIRELIGDNGYEELARYENTTVERGTINQLETRLSYSGNPLNSAQSEALLNILTDTGANMAAIRPSAGPDTDPAAMRLVNIPGPTITDEVINRAQSVLAPDQLNALQQIQAEQQAQQAVGTMMRSQLQRNGPSQRPGGGG